MRLPELPPYLGRDERPLVYLTLGTVNNHLPALAHALDALTGLQARILATLGPNADPATLGTQPPHVTVERWVPQAQVLEHCDVVVSHGGSGTFLGALAAGLPQLFLPQAADQFRNAAAGAGRGAGLRLDPHQTAPEAIAGAVRRLLEVGSFRVAAAEVATEIAAMPSPAEVVPVLAALV